MALLESIREESLHDLKATSNSHDSPAIIFTELYGTALSYDRQTFMIHSLTLSNMPKHEKCSDGPKISIILAKLDGMEASGCAWLSGMRLRVQPNFREHASS